MNDDWPEMEFTPGDRPILLVVVAIIAGIIAGLGCSM